MLSHFSTVVNSSADASGSGSASVLRRAGTTGVVSGPGVTVGVDVGVASTDSTSPAGSFRITESV